MSGSGNAHRRRPKSAARRRTLKRRFGRRGAARPAVGGGRVRGAVVLVARGQASNLQTLGQRQEVGQPLLGDVDLTLVHEVDQQLEVVGLDVPQQNDRVVCFRPR